MGINYVLKWFAFKIEMGGAATEEPFAFFLVHWQGLLTIRSAQPASQYKIKLIGLAENQMASALH